MMDIYKYAKEFNADYIDKDGNVYQIQTYNRAFSFGLPSEGIEIYDAEGHYLGIAQQIEGR